MGVYGATIVAGAYAYARKLPGFGGCGLGLWVSVWGFVVWGFGLGVWGLGFRVWGLGFRVWGLGVRV